MKPPPAWVKPFEAQTGSATLPCGCVVGAWPPHVVQQPCDKLARGALAGVDTSRAFEDPASVKAAVEAVKAHVAVGTKARAAKVRKPSQSAKAKQAAFA